jgi:hypothetical protein
MVIDNIVEYMNARGCRKFTRYEGSVIRDCIKKEYKQKNTRPLGLNPKTKKGRDIINNRVVHIAKTEYDVMITAKDVWLYKKCFADEYSDRTGKCAWGFREVRKKLGYDPKTGAEIR